MEMITMHEAVKTSYSGNHGHPLQIRDDVVGWRRGRMPSALRENNTNQKPCRFKIWSAECRRQILKPVLETAEGNIHMSFQTLEEQRRRPGQASQGLR